MPKITWDFELQSDHPITSTRLDLMLIKKEKGICHLVYFNVSTDYTIKIREKKNQSGRKILRSC